MIPGHWIEDALGVDTLEKAMMESARRRIDSALRRDGMRNVSEHELRFVAEALELQVFEILNVSSPSHGDTYILQEAANRAFQVGRSLILPQDPIKRGERLVRLGCLGVLGDRGPDVRRILFQVGLPGLPVDSPDWGIRVWATILDVWLRLFRKDGWDDLELVQHRIMTLRDEQQTYEPGFLSASIEQADVSRAWELVSSYHLAKAAEVLATYLGQGSSEGLYDIREQLQAQFDRAVEAAGSGALMERENVARLLQRTASVLVDNSIWTVTRAVNSRVTKFVESMTTERRHDGRMPIFEMLPPQRKALREAGLLGSSHRSVVVSLPTSSGKTLIAQFRMLQALNQFDQERGWVAYVAPTRALVNQITRTLRNAFQPLGITVEKVSPALEIDGTEAAMLLEQDSNHEFRVLVTTPEKLDLMLRGGWEGQIGRPLTLVVVDEAHNLASYGRGLKLELLLATINRSCRHAQFLLLTPFIPNKDEIATWLDPDSHASVDLGVEWVPNDRVIALAEPERGQRLGDFVVRLQTEVTNRPTLHVPESIILGENRPLKLSWSKVKSSANQLAAATASQLRKRGSVIVLVNQPRYSWTVAESLANNPSSIATDNEDLQHIIQFLTDEMGGDFPLINLLHHGVGVHHSGLSDDTRALVEWMMEKGHVHTLVATTTIAQGMNFPVAGVVFASHQYPGRWPRLTAPMPSEDFWNIVGRAGRVDQEDLGIIALAAPDAGRSEEWRKFLRRSVEALNSTLVDMVAELESVGDLLRLERLYREPQWSSFLQYLAHTYRQVGSHERFAIEIEQILRGTLGFQALRKSNKEAADILVKGVYSYAQRIKGKPLQFVDATGFSWESVNRTLAKLSEARVTDDVWSADLFGSRRGDLTRLMGILLEVPELRAPLQDVVGGDEPDGDKLARIVVDWVQGRPLTEMAQKYFAKAKEKDGPSTGSVDALTNCCRLVFGRLTQTASWGLSALQTLTFKDKFEKLSPDEQRNLRNLPARVYYGVNSDEAVTLRLLGVPRAAAQNLAEKLEIQSSMPLHQARSVLHSSDETVWRAALGSPGGSYHRVWTILQGVL